MKVRLTEKFARYIADVAEALNNLPEIGGYYLRVELREKGTHRKVGEWSEGNTPDSWYFDTNTKEEA